MSNAPYVGCKKMADGTWRPVANFDYAAMMNASGVAMFCEDSRIEWLNDLTNWLRKRFTL